VEKSAASLNRFRDLLGLAVFCGLVAGVLQLGGLAIRKYAQGNFLYVGSEVIWTIPLVTTIAFVAVAGAVALLRPVLGRWLGWPLAFGLYAAATVFAILYQFPQLHRFAALFLSLAFGTQLARTAARRAAGFAPFVRRSVRWLAGLYLLVVIGLFSLSGLRERVARNALGEAQSGMPNVLLIILDTVRSANLSTYGYDRETTPNLSRIAESGVRFVHAFSTAPWTLPAHGSLFTGRYAHELEADWRVPLDDRFPTLAEELAKAGFFTCGSSANPDYATTEVGVGRGFLRFEDHTFSAGELLRSTPLTLPITRNRMFRRLIGEDIMGRRRAPSVNRSAQRCIDDAGDRPFFVFLNYYEAHRPYLPPEPYRSRFVPDGEGLDPRAVRVAEPGDDTLASKTAWAVNAYDGALAYLDAELGTLFDGLAASGALDNTLVIIASDHGEEFGEHRVFDHGHSLYRQALEVPLIVLLPGRDPTNVAVERPVTLRSIPATILDVLGLESESSIPGRSLAPLWTSDDAGIRDEAGTRDEAGIRDDSGTRVDSVLADVRKAIRQPEWYPASQGDLRSLVSEGFHYIVNRGTGEEELYDFAEDPSERVDLIETPTGRRFADDARPALQLDGDPQEALVPR